jgi:hypothetical protein
MIAFSQSDAQLMHDALTTIASFHNPAVQQDGAQAAARLARETLEAIKTGREINPPRD